MSAPRTPGIYICMMTLLTTAALAWASIVAPCIEIGFFWASAGSALAVAFFAWRKSEQISQSGMLAIYVMLGCSITLAVASIADLANYTFLGEQYDAESGVLLGGVISFCLLAVIAARLSSCYPNALAWGALTACCMSWWYTKICSKEVFQEYPLIIITAAVICGLTAFIVLCRNRQRLTDSQYLSVLCIIMTFIGAAMPSSKENIAAEIFESMMLVLAGKLFFSVRVNVPSTVTVGGMMLLYFGVSSVIFVVFHKWLGVNEILVGVPSLIFCMLIIYRVRLLKGLLPRGLYWVSQFVFVYFSIFSIMPEQYSDTIGSVILEVIGLFILSCVWYAPSSSNSSILPDWRYCFRLVCSISCLALVITVTNAWFTVTVDMLVYNNGPARVIARLNNTRLWPGDKAFIRFAMQDESLWAENIQNVSESVFSTKKFLEEIRPGQDRFSKIRLTEKTNKNEQGVDDESMGLSWVAGVDNLILTKVESKSPAGNVGLTRGDRIFSFNGIRIRDIKSDDAWRKLIGKWKNDKTIELEVVTRTGADKTVSMEIGDSVQDTPLSKVIQTDKGNIGYLFLEEFNAAQIKDIEKHFAEFKKAGIRDLVLDLRYNHGGYIKYASMLTDLIAGGKLNDKLYVRTEHSARYQDRSAEYVFATLPESINVSRLVVLTTDETCSASETVINGLRPYMPVYTVGSTTCGKPYVMESIEFGENTLLPVTARVLNSRGEGHYIKGIRPDFKAEDDLTHQLGDPKERMLKKALEVLEKETFRM